VRSVYDYVPVLHCAGKAVEGSRCRASQNSACDAELRAVTGAKNDVTFREIIHSAFLVRAFVCERQHSCWLPYQ